MILVIDIETDALENPQNIWCVVAKDITSDKEYRFRDNGADRSLLRDMCHRCDYIVGHNFLAYDLPVLNDLWKLNVSYKKVVDTLVVGRTVMYSMKNGHSLKAWGERLGYPKDGFDDFTRWSHALEERCAIDVDITARIFDHFRRFIEDPAWKDSLRLEHDTVVALESTRKRGMYYDIEGAEELYLQLNRRLDALNDEMARAFPPRATKVREVTPRETKHGTLHRSDFRWLGTDPILDGYSPGCSFSVLDWNPFNPGSPSQVVERLTEAGWKPVEKTKSGKSWRVSEDNLATLPEDAPAACQHLVEWLLLSSRVRRLEEWRKVFNPATHRIHGKITHIGCWTQRCAHTAPNMGNVPSLNSKYQGEKLRQLAYEYGKSMRSLWRATPGYKLVGCDAEGIQLRLFAHYINDDAFTHALVAGNKEDGTDAHSLNAQALGEGVTRAQAKTFIYSFLLGAGVGKTAQVLGVSVGEAEERRAGFIARYPGLQQLRDETIPEDVRRGYFVGLDGRKVFIPHEKREGNTAGFVLGAYLQNGESTIMKWAMRKWMEEVEGSGARLVNFIHDEWQTEAYPQDADYVGQVQADSIVAATDHFQLNCPMAGEYVIGDNWYETH